MKFIEDCPIVGKVFLGGTSTGIDWRSDLIPELKKRGISYFNPIVEDWTPDCIAIEDKEKNYKCNVHLYVITPDMKGVYSIAEIINSVWQATYEAKYEWSVDTVYFVVLGEFDEARRKSLSACMKMCHDIAEKFEIKDKIHTGFINNIKDIFNL